MKLIVGLGNPGKEYKNTRHNVGFMALDVLAEKLGLPDFKMERKFNAEISAGALPSTKVILAKPETFMNNSGSSVRALMDFYKIKSTSVIVIHDDKDIALGDYKIQNNRGAAGHNGVKSIMEHLGTQDFTRVRLGVAPAKHEISNTADFVLGKFGKNEQQAIESVITLALPEVIKLLGQ